MYPLIRFAKELVKFRNAPKLGPLDAHVSTHMCWPWDLDPWIELNNGRTLTLYDLGRIPLAVRTGLTILSTLLRLYPEQVSFLEGRRPFFDLLVGQSWVRPALIDGMAVSDMEARWQPALGAFAERRRPFLLYA